METVLPTIDLPRKPHLQQLKLAQDFFTTFSILEQNYEQCFLLESLGDDHFDSRYALIGFAPDIVFTGKDGVLEITTPDGDTKKYKTKNPYNVLREIIPKNILTQNYAGGLVGYLGYDAVSFFEPKLTLEAHPYFEKFIFGLYTDGLLHDKLTGETTYFYYLKNRFADIQNHLKNDPSIKPLVHTQFMGFSKSKKEHAEMVNAAISEINAGNTFQVQIGFTAKYTIKGNALAIYEALRLINPSPHCYYMKFGKKIILGASPELIFRLRQGEMESYPLAGTAPRGENALEDMTLVKNLLHDAKEIAEHNMLIDLHRNDIGRVARFGTVKVRRSFDIKRFSHVQHISSEVVGIIAPGEDAFTGLASVYPAGTLSGAPKIESMKIIERIEREPRGPYGGAIGHFGFNGDCTFAIPIRTIFINDEEAFSRASGGIVFDSNIENEYQEVINKLAASKRALDIFIKEQNKK